AAGGGGVRLEARGRGRGRSEARREMGPAPRRRAVGAAVLPDAGPVRAVDRGPRGPQPSPEPGGVAALLSLVERLAVAGVEPGRAEGGEPIKRGRPPTRARPSQDRPPG